MIGFIFQRYPRGGYRIPELPSLPISAQNSFSTAMNDLSRVYNNKYVYTAVSTYLPVFLNFFFFLITLIILYGLIKKKKKNIFLTIDIITGGSASSLPTFVLQTSIYTVFVNVLYVVTIFGH